MLGTILLVLFAPQANQKNPNLFYDEMGGISIEKPAKLEEWEFKTPNSGSGILVTHKVYQLLIALSIGQVVNANDYSTKNAAEETWKEISASNKFKDLQRKGLTQLKLPGGAAGGVVSHKLDMTYKNEENASIEWSLYFFNSRLSDKFYQISVVGEAGLEAKYRKQIELILSTIRVYKVPKK